VSFEPTDEKVEQVHEAELEAIKEREKLTYIV